MLSHLNATVLERDPSYEDQMVQTQAEAQGMIMLCTTEVLKNDTDQPETMMMPVLPDRRQL